MFHRVLPECAVDDFKPVQEIAVTPEMLHDTITRVLAAGYDIISLSQARERILARKSARKFVCLTFDDGFRDNYEVAFPICRDLGVPMTIYITTGFIEGTRVMCWYGLETLVAQNESVRFVLDGREHMYPTRSQLEKGRAYWEIDGLLRSATEQDKTDLMNSLKSTYAVDFARRSRDQMMTWDMISRAAQYEGMEIGAHTVTHPALSSLGENEAREEIDSSRRTLEQHLGKPVSHFAYPYGTPDTVAEREFTLCRELGFSTAVTTRYGNVFPGHKDMLHNLPRIPVNSGDSRTAIDVKLHGVATPLRALHRYFRPEPKGTISRYPLGTPKGSGRPSYATHV